MTGTLDAQAPVRRPLPRARLSWRAKRQLRRAAARLARRDEPAVEVGSGPLTTDERELFFAERDSVLTELRLAAQQRLDLIFRELDPLPRTIADLQKALERAERDLVHAESVAPRVGAVDRRPSEALASDAVLFARRSREHRRSLAAAEAAVARARDELGHAESSRDVLQAAERAVRERHDAERLVTHHLAVLKRSVFDESLAKHHPLRDILEPRLDKRVQPIPPHLAAGLYGDAVPATPALVRGRCAVTFVPFDDPPSPLARLRRWLTRPAWLALRVRRSLAPPALSIDIERPSLFTAYPRVPDPADHVAAIRRRITELFQSHAIDEGTPRILDDSIDAVADMWKGQVQLEHLERSRAAAYEIARLEARAAIRAERIAELEKHLQRTEVALAVAGQATGPNSAARRNPKGERS